MLAYAIGAAIAALVLARRTWPLVVLLGSAVLLLTYYTLDYPGIAPAVPLSVAVGTVAAALPLRWPAGVAAFFMVAQFLSRHSPTPLVLGDAVRDAALLLAVILLGLTIRNRAERLAEVDARAQWERDEQREATPLGVLTRAAGLVTLASTFQHATARLAAKLGSASLLVGAAIYLTEHIIDGVARKGLSDAWAAAPPAGRADIELAAQTAFTMLRGPSLIAILTLWEVPLVLFGLAARMAGLDRCPRAPPYRARRDGPAASARFVQMWSLALGVLMWRHAPRPAPVST